MFGKGKKTTNVVVEISDASRLLLEGLDNDIQALVGMVDELVATHTKIIDVLKGEIADATDNGVVVFADEVENDLPTAYEEPQAVGPEIRLPQTMQQQASFPHGRVEDDDRIRDTPFTRSPRSTQVEWLRTEVMTDGGWYNAVGIARTVANDERHYRYLRHAIGGRLREMHEDGICERRSSRMAGAMFEYRLKEVVQ